MFNYNQATNLYLFSLKVDKMSEKTLETYSRILGYYKRFCDANGLNADVPASVALYKAKMASNGNKLVTMTMHLNILRLFFAYCIRMKLTDQAENPVLDELFPPRKKVRAERKPYSHLMGESELKTLFTGNRPSGVHRSNFLRNRAILFVLLGCGLRNTELRSLKLRDLYFTDEEEYAHITVWNGKGDKYRTVPFPSVVRQAVLAYLASDERPEGLADSDILFGTGKTRDEWRMMTDENLSMMCKRYIKNATGFEGARSHACRHAFASFNLTHGVPMAEIQSMLGHSSIMTTEHYASLLRPTAPTASGNKVFNDLFSQTSMV